MPEQQSASSAAASGVRERVLDAAERIASEGCTALTMSRLATEAGVSRATIYRRFGSAEGLREALAAERDTTPITAQDTRTRILDAALAEFVGASVHGATVQDIAQRAGVTPMTVYNHFDDKEGLVAALIAERGPSGLPLAQFAALGGPAAAIEAFVHGAVRLVTSQKDLLSLVIAPDPITRRAFRRVRAGAGDAGSALEKLFENVDLPEGVEPRVAAACLMGMIIANGALRPMLFGEEVADAEELASSITSLFTRAIDLTPP